VLGGDFVVGGNGVDLVLHGESEMSVDLTKLAAAPWIVHQCSHDDADPGECFVKFTDPRDDLSTDSTMMDRDHCEFIALARNAFDVMMRRGWSVQRYVGSGPENGMWFVDMKERAVWLPCWPDPFTALVEADKSYTEHVEGRHPR
jgi:hypothetical protein